MKLSYRRIFTQTFGILLLWGILSICKLRWKDIGFTSDGIVSGVGKGLLFGLVCSIFAYTVEFTSCFFMAMFTYPFMPVVFP